MKGLVRQDELAVLFGREAAFHEIQIHVLIEAVEFVSNNRMADVRKMNANLVLAAGERLDLKQAECPF